MLTDREREVAGLAIAGLTNREIGNELYIETDTAKTHLRNIFRKLGCKNRTQIAVKIPQMGNGCSEHGCYN